MCKNQYVVMIATNETNKGNPEIRAYVVTDEELAADMVGWLHANDIKSEVVTLDRYHERLQDYRERVAAAS